MSERLQKIIARAGIASRRKAEELILSGRVSVNGEVATQLGSRADAAHDTVRVDGKVLRDSGTRRYLAMHKPKGCVTTTDDPEGRPTLKDFIARIKERVYPVGRLDYNSEGLILLTNDGDLTNFIISAKNKIPKIYMVKIKGILKDEVRKKIKTKGIHMDGLRVKPMRIDFIKKTPHGKNSWVRITIVEGKKHIIRKMFKYIGHPVEKLKRTAIGTIRLKTLPAGHWRELSPEELVEFKRTYRFPE